jgi:apolipoprotein N-acyltransferase
MRVSEPQSPSMSQSVACGFALVHAALFALAFPPFDLWLFAPLIPAPLAWMALRARRTLPAVVIAITVQFAMWLWLVRWIIPVTPVGYPALALYLSVWAGVFVWALRRVKAHQKFNRWPMMAVLPILWTGVEFFRGDVLFYGYPWYQLSHPMIAWLPFVQSADLLGSYFVSFLCAMISGFIIDVANHRLRRTASEQRRWNPAYAVILLATMLGANIAYGLWRMNQGGALSIGPRVLAIQTNLPQDNKTRWTIEQQNVDVPLFIDLTRKAFAATEPRPDVIAWPETMVPGLGFEPDVLANLRILDLPHLRKWPEAIIALSAELSTPMIVGTESWTGTTLTPHENKGVWELQQSHTYNSAALVFGDTLYGRYDKYFLTPFGETMPYISSWPWLERQLLTLGVGADLAFNLDSNPEIRLLEVEGRVESPPPFSLAGARSSDAASKGETVYRFATPICFEDTVGRYCRRMVYRGGGGRKEADAFINISNDGWFNASRADRKLHAQIARLRCIENRIPMIRAVNTGMSVAIDSSGRLIAAVGGDGYGVSHQPGWVAAVLPLDSRHSFYGRVGEVWPWACLAASVIGVGLSFFRGPTNSKRKEFKA